MVDLEILRSSALLAGCDESEAEQVAAIATSRHFQDGACLFRHGDEARELMVVESGQVQLEFPVDVFGQTRTVAFETKGPGSVVGWSSLGRSSRFTLTARAVGHVHTIALPQTSLELLFDSQPGLGIRLLRNVLSVVHVRLEKTHAMWTREIQRSVDNLYR